MPGSGSGGGEGSGAGGAISGGSDFLGEVLNFFGNYLSWEQTSTSLTRDMKAADDNAQIAAMLSADAIRRGNIEGAKIRMQGTQLAAREASAYQGGGVDPTVGTPADMAMATEANTSLDAQMQVNNAYRESFGFKQQKKKFEREKQNLRSEYSAKQDQYSLNQVGTVVRGAGSLWKMGGGMGG